MAAQRYCCFPTFAAHFTWLVHSTCATASTGCEGQGISYLADSLQGRLLGSLVHMMHSTILPGLTRSASPVGRFVKGKSVINSPDMKPQDLPLLYPLSSIRACMYKQAENRIMSLR